jgi:hypothetical protein
MIRIGGRANVVKKAVAAPIRKGSFSFNRENELLINENNAISL